MSTRFAASVSKKLKNSDQKTVPGNELTELTELMVNSYKLLTHGV